MAGKSSKARGQGRSATSSGTRPVSAGVATRSGGPALVAPPRQWPLLVALASTLGVAVGVVVIALSLMSAGSPTGVAGVSSAPVPQGPERRAVGSPNAPVVVTEWFDFQCPACRAYALTRDAPLEQQYTGTGQVRFVYRNYAFLGLESLVAAEAAECAADQGRYQDYRLLLFQRQRGENLGAFRPENLKSFARELGLNQATFNACLDDGVHRQEVLAEKKEGEAQGVNATPTIFVNDRKMDGVPSLDRMKAAIEEELAKKR